MSKRLQVIFDETEYALLKRHARKARVSLGAWVRMALRRITDSESANPQEQKLRALKIAASINAPIDDVETMNKQIISGYFESSQK